jgi:hypothetical protein
MTGVSLKKNIQKNQMNVPNLLWTSYDCRGKIISKVGCGKYLLQSGRVGHPA